MYVLEAAGFVIGYIHAQVMQVLAVPISGNFAGFKCSFN
jgi:hypothetical protein